ncbi:g-type lectin s-receptor-like serine/threonine-protein kinase at4g27290 [Phtheirospermum japonicum]|uniref:Receptor-like serine/threonine-protein kinase n=1 Tax=Phtheirospermum japonicum TaxID=374723 RepID=A0A830B175_9LAMI|nr:g-type lectin s-receptor-like serine/threonine-protein kinase at4g27290 [Phtheirospermum japonicum]
MNNQITRDMEHSFLPILLTFCLIIHQISAANDTIDVSQSIRDGETLVSSGGMFELGFFSPGNSTNRYLGIWYNNISVQTVVWVANRRAPLTTNSGVLRVTVLGNLTISNNDVIVWSSNVSRSVRNPSAQLLDSGNLVVKDANEDGNNFLWESFDYPTDTFLPGMGIGWDYTTGVESYISSWTSNNDPSPGECTSHLDPTGYPQIFRKRGDTIVNRIGPWIGVRFSGARGTQNEPTLRMTRTEVKYREDNADPSLITMLKKMLDCATRRWTWDARTSSWNVSSLSTDECERYNLCGAHGLCNIGNSPSSCGCLDGFVPRNRGSWGRNDWSEGCERRAALRCGGPEVFVRYRGVKLPDARNTTFNDTRMGLTECEAVCLRNCSCTAYTQLDIREERGGCLFYHGELRDIRTLSDAGQDLYVRMASTDSGSKGKNRVILIASLTSVGGVIVIVCLGFVLFCCRKRKDDANSSEAVAGPFSGNQGNEAELPLNHGKDSDLPFFNLSTILEATDNFAIQNKIGEGGFGPVYKGMLENGQEIAVKCLSKTSSQGIKELKNEVILVAKLQHRNLARLLGCCIERDENMLIYEFVPNSSLDFILFDQTKSKLLDWKKRFNIINGIAKGLLYLHQDSRLRIIHRDLKASNILLDSDMNAKISDFGLARSFGGSESEVQTRRVVGTYGYMSPEYAIDGLFSVKSDVFSFGVLVLEIVSGKRNRGFALDDHNLNLLGHAWTLYKEDNSCELVDASLGNSFDVSEVMRSIHVGLLCVQERPDDRPSMSTVVFMLGNDVELPPAKQPGFFSERDVSFVQSSISSNAFNSENQVTVTMFEGR